MSRDNRREERFVVEVAGRYRARHGASRDIWIKDISEYGCRFFDKFSILEIDSEILIKVGNIGPIPTEVKWRDGSTVGGEFERPLHPSVLDHIRREMDRRDSL
ncbi:hypothetical protein [Erythrobacter mangrovi]|uniref:PilZ domain-containing protein n=1 Tax=Erythrobacter mangrovi TaxID=2739433 RepID=A0A7D3XCW3_9SPHN|nr:hypothetical protein [Erythrobacter mangrovi]QKG72080.1 hypothetical protein HQR01_12285 [Erythrobacter mangrovi]